MKKHIDVVGAVIRADDRILCAQRGPIGHLPGRWEFPGGKVEPDEAPRDALVREISEELKCRVIVGSEVTTTIYEYDFGVVKLTTFACELVAGTPELTEHSEVQWLLPTELSQLVWAPADIEAVDILQADVVSLMPPKP